MINILQPYPVNFSGIKEIIKNPFNQKQENNSDKKEGLSIDEFCSSNRSDENIALVLDSNVKKVVGIGHGNLVFDIVKDNTSKIKTVLIDTGIKNTENIEINKFIKILEKIVERVDEGEKIQAINLSQTCYATDLFFITYVTGLPLTKENVYQYREEIKKILFNSSSMKIDYNKETFKLLKKEIELLEYLANEKGIKIFGIIP